MATNKKPSSDGLRVLHVIYKDNDNVLQVDQLKNGVDGSFLNAATVTVTVTTTTGDNVLPDNWPVTMSYVAASDGRYQAILEEDLVLTADTEYVAIIDADAGSDLRGHWEVPLIAEVRTG